eukprot:166061_1
MRSCDKHCICTDEYAPICCDQTEYGNACEARYDGMVKPSLCGHGRCGEQEKEDGCIHASIIDYSNACVAKCDGKDVSDDKQCSRGRYDSDGKCTTEYDAVCCDDK